MKHLHYDHLVISISDQLATMIEMAAVLHMNAGRYTVWPVAGYRDEREEISVQLVFGPGIPFAITDTWLPDDRPDARYTEDSIGYISAEHDSLEKDLDEEP